MSRVLPAAVRLAALRAPLGSGVRTYAAAAPRAPMPKTTKVRAYY